MSFRRLTCTVVSALLVLAPAVAALGQAPTTFRKLDFYVQEGEEMKDHDAQLILDVGNRRIVFSDEDDANRVFAIVSWDRITGVSYENSKHARITAGLLVAWPMLFLKGKKHWLTVTYGPTSDGSPGGYAFARMDKDNFQRILAAINGFTGYEVRRIEENGEISILYPGTRQAEPPAAAPAPGPAAPAQTGATVAAGALPPEPADDIPAAPLPPIAAGHQPLVLVNKGVQWTTRGTDAVGYAWAAEVENPNPVALDSAVVIRLYDAQGGIVHAAQRQVSVPPGETFAFTEEGAVPEAAAVRGDHWSFEVLEPAGPPANTAPTVAETNEPPTPAPGPTTAAPTGQPGLEAVPLTPEMEVPKLIPQSARIVLEDPQLLELDLTGKNITIRCLIRADGTVADAVVFRISPAISLEAAEKTLKEGVRKSAIEFWKFFPARKEGVAVPVWHMVTVNYQPGG